MRLAFVVASLFCNAAVASTGIRALRAGERRAYEAKDWPAFLKVEQALVDAAPVPRHLYGLACAEALSGHKDAAIAALDRAVSFGYVFPAASDEDLASLRGDPRFDALVKRTQDAARPHGTIPVALELPRSDLIVEDLARDPRTRTWYFTSVRKRAVFAMTDGGPLRQLARTPWAALGLDFDAKRGVLWVGTAALEEEDDHVKADEGSTAVVEIDARTGDLKQRYDAPAKGALGDLRLGPDGTVYVSDGLAGVVYSLRSGGKLEVLAGEGFLSPQTQAVRGRELIVADYSLGVAAIDLETRKIRFISRQTGIDGLALAGNDLYAVQNGTNPPRVLRLRGDTIDVVQSGGDLPDPTHAIVSEGALWVIARSGWEKSGKPPLVKRLQLLKSPTGHATPVPPSPQ